MDIVQQSHLHLGANRERAILKAIARDAKRRPHVVEDAVGCCEALDRMKGDPLRGVEHAQIHVLDRLPPSIANVASRRFPDGILGIKLDAFIDAVRVFSCKCMSTRSRAYWHFSSYVFGKLRRARSCSTVSRDFSMIFMMFSCSRSTRVAPE